MDERSADGPADPVLDALRPALIRPVQADAHWEDGAVPPPAGQLEGAPGPASVGSAIPRLMAPMVLRAKLHPPRIGDDVLARPRLFGRLDAGIERGLTLVVAPAGYGKSTLLSSWVRHIPRTVAWLSLDVQDNHLLSFVASVVAAISLVLASPFPNTMHLVRRRVAAEGQAIVAMLCNEIDALPAELVLVLDDYQLITNLDVQALVGTLASHLPSPLQVVISSHVEPSLPLSRLRAAGQVAEIRAPDLRFTEEEARALIASVTRGEVDEALAVNAIERAEGWAAGLRLLAPIASQGVGPADMAAIRPATSQHVADFLLREVFAQQPLPIQRLLLATSLVDRFCAPLCEALLGQGDVGMQPGSGPANRPLPDAGAGAVDAATPGALERLERTQLFLVPLDDRHEWFRYHALFLDVLRQWLASHVDERAIATLRAQAGAWFVQHGLIDEAVRLLVAAGEQARAIRLIEENVHAMLDQEDWLTLETWLGLLSERDIGDRPTLLVARAWLRHVRGRADELPALLEAASSLLASGGPGTDAETAARLHAEIDVLWSLVWLVRGEFRRSLDASSRAALGAPRHHALARSLLDWTRALALVAIGEDRLAREELLAALDHESDEPPLRRARYRYVLASIAVQTGQYHEAELFARQLVQLGERFSLKTSATLGHALLGHILYEWDDLAASRQQFEAVLAMRENASRVALRNALVGLALIQRDLGEQVQVATILDDLLGIDDVPGVETYAPARSLAAHLLLQQGELAAATRYAQMVDAEAIRLRPSPDVDDMVPLIQARILVALGTDASLLDASEKLDTLARLCEERHDTSRLIRFLALQAVTFSARGQVNLALDTARRALQLGEAGGFVRSFVDVGQPMGALIGRLAARDDVSIRPDYLARVLISVNQPSPDAGQPDPRGSAAADPIDPLTPRERQVLELLAIRLSNKEIARRLAISPLTVKRHTLAIYDKLGVRGRAAATTRARALGLVDPP